MTAFGECHEGVTRREEFQPCNKPAVALRVDPEGDRPYPVCAHHSRGPMVPLIEAAAIIVTAVNASAAVAWCARCRSNVDANHRPTPTDGDPNA